MIAERAKRSEGRRLIRPGTPVTIEQSERVEAVGLIRAKATRTEGGVNRQIVLNFRRKLERKFVVRPTKMG